MLLVVLNREGTTLVAGVPNGQTVKLCTHPVQLDKAKAFDERFVANAKTAQTAVKLMIEKATAQSKANGKGELVHYVEISNELESEKKLLLKIAAVSEDGVIGDVAIEVRRGIFFAGRSECTIDVRPNNLYGEKSLERFQEMLEIARFAAYEIGQ